ncbi:MAG TPA: hypothetical protein VGM19_12295 [Armatimonadota bacterium]|jgi:hypothetical protein
MQSPTQLTIDFRIGYDHYASEGRLQRLIAFLDRQRSAVDEVSLFTERAHGFHPIGVLRQRLDTIGQALTALRAEGWRVGINVLNTIGHLDESPQRFHRVPWQPMVGHDGTAAEASSCPADSTFLVDVYKRYRMFAGLHPDFIWVDDDVRMAHHPPVVWGCFCPQCLRDFSRRMDRTVSRDHLVELLREESWPEPNHYRSAWVERNSEVLQNLLLAAERGAHEENPQLELGLMVCSLEGNGYSGLCDLPKWLDLLSGVNQAPVRLRPGGGFYTDYKPQDCLDKALSMGRTVAYSRPERLSSIQAEIENFPYQRLMKSVQVNLAESAADLGAGCNGIAFNILPDGPNPFDDYELRLAGIARWRPFYEQLNTWNRGLVQRGLWVAYHVEFDQRGYCGGDYPSHAGAAFAAPQRVLRELGMPLAYRPVNSCAVVFTGAMVTAFSPEEVRELLRGGAVVDWEAAQWIDKMGLGSLLGVKATEIAGPGLRERLSGHPLNGDFAWQYRDARTGFFGGQAGLLEPFASGVQVLAEVVDYDDFPYGVAVSAYENPEGGRVVVLGYAPWQFTHSSAKRNQLGHLAAWVSRDTVPAWTDLCHPLSLFVRGGESGAPLTVSLVNGSADHTGPYQVRVTSPGERALLATPDQPQPLDLELLREDGEHAVVTLPDLAPWSLAALRIE